VTIEAQVLGLLPWFGHLLGLHRAGIEQLSFEDFAAYRSWISDRLNGGGDG